MKTKRLTAYAMVFILICLSLPIDALSNLQNPVNDLSITDYSDRNSSSYTVSLNWSRPLLSQQPEPGETAVVLHQVEGYEVFYRNATRSEQFTTSINDPGLKNNTSDPINVNYTLNLRNSSLYEFRVQPVHYHNISNPNGTTTIRPAPIDNSLSESLVLYLTDIELSAKGSGHYMTVTWDIPTYNGREVFTGYRIYYAAGGAEVTSIPMTPYVEVPANSPDLVRTRDGKLQYTFYDGNLMVGKLYAVKVEPLYNGKLVRNREPHTTQFITINNREFNLSFRNMRDREYRVNDAYISPALHVQPDGQDYIRLYWDSLKTAIQNIDSLEIYRCYSEDMYNKQFAGVLSGDSASDINFWLTARPDTITYYQIKINYKDSSGRTISVWSEIVWFDPAYNDFTPYKPTILSVTDNAMRPFSMTVQWQAFIRPPYNQTEKQNIDMNYNSQYIDRNMVYDIYVTNDIRNFDNPLFNDKIIATLPASRLSLTAFKTEPEILPSYIAAVSEYYSISESGEITLKPLQDNMVYYIKITAARDPGGQLSRPAAASHFIRPAGNVDASPLMMTKPPLRVKIDELGVEQVTDKAITIQWDTEYYEVYNNADKSWHAVVGVGDDGKLLFGSETGNIPDPSRIIYLNAPKYLAANTGGEALIVGDLLYLGADPNEITALSVRFMDIKDSQYEIHTARYDHIQAQGGYEAYLKALQTADGATEWVTLTPTGDPLHPEYTVLREDAPNKGGLSTNSAYVIFFRPYVVRNGKKNAYFPSYVMATTRELQPPLDITPTVPVLEGAGQSDTSVTVRWLYTPDLLYELQYSEKSVDYPNNGIEIPWDVIRQTVAVVNENGKVYLSYTIKDLFPYTPHHIWIRAAADNALGLAYSAWSNPIIMKTDDIIPPNPPQGLGPADQEHVNYYDKATGNTYVPVGETYLIMEWMRNQADKPELDENDNITEPQIPPPTENAAFLYVPEVQEMYMVMFSGLLTNKLYYSRAKTVLTLTRDTDGLRRRFSYTIQLSGNPGFLDAYEITIPELLDLSGIDPHSARRKESEWSKTIQVYTARSDLEYDGKASPEMYPLPDRDYEIIYDDYTQTLTFRFRTDQTDKNGDHDNNTDQRFISRLIEKKTYVYSVDLTRYFYLPVKQRILDMPYSIFAAFNERLIALKVTAGSISVTFPPGSLSDEKLKALHDFGMDSRIRVSLTENDPETPVLNRFESYASRPQRLEIRVKSPAREIKINQTALPLIVDLHLLHPLYEYPSHVGAYMAHMDTVGWEQCSARPNMQQDALSFDVYDTALYAAISTGAPAVVPYHFYGSAEPAVQSAIRFVTSKIRLTDMDVLIPNTAVSAGQMNQLVYAIANDKLSTALNAPLNDSDSAALKKAGLFMEKSPVIRQDAITVLVQLYEIKTGRPVTAYKNILETPFTDILQAAEEYRTPLLKAAQLGMLSALNEQGLRYADELPLYYAFRANPAGYLTAGDMFRMAEIVLRDAHGKSLEEDLP